jgi:hypothetical protein
MIRESETTQMNTMPVGKGGGTWRISWNGTFFTRIRGGRRMICVNHEKWRLPVACSKTRQGRVGSRPAVMWNARTFDVRWEWMAHQILPLNHHLTLTVLKKVAVFEYLQQRNPAHLWRRPHGEEMCKCNTRGDHGQKDDDIIYTKDTSTRWIIDDINLYYITSISVKRKHGSRSCAGKGMDGLLLPVRSTSSKNSKKSLRSDSFNTYHARRIYDGRQSKAERGQMKSN